MGNYFVMSTRFNKCNASDFGFIFKDSKTAINPKDDSIWTKSYLYDFGWGKENGFYKEPLPDFDLLFEIAMYSTNSEDMYGASAVILEKYPDELLCKCELFMKDFSRKKGFKRMVKLFNLDFPINRCSICGKTNDQIQSDYIRWKAVAEAAMKV